MSITLLVPAAGTLWVFGAMAPVFSADVLSRFWLLLTAATGLALIASGVARRVWRVFRLPGRAADFLPVRWIRSRLASRRIKRSLSELAAVPPGPHVLDALQTLARSLEQRDPYTRIHAGRVSRLTVNLLEHVGASNEIQELGRLAGLLHDVGKIEIPDSILRKEGPLTSDEERVMRGHALIGARLVEPYTTGEVSGTVLHHHERVDGAGYPEGVESVSLPIIVRAVSVCDTYDTIISDRPYRAALTRREALRELRRAAGSQLDSDLVEALIAMERGKHPMATSVGALLPFLAVMRRSTAHALHTSTIPASVATTVLGVVTAVSLGVVGVSSEAPAPGGPPPPASEQAVIEEEAPFAAPLATPEGAAEAATPSVVEDSSVASDEDDRAEPEGGDEPGPAPEPPPEDEPCQLPTGTEIPEFPIVGCAADLLPGN